MLTVALASTSASAVPQDRMGALWIAESGGILNIATASGALRFEIPHDLGISNVAVNDVNGDLWAYGKKNLYQYTRQGRALRNAATPPWTHGGDPVDMVVDGTAGNLWIAIERELYRFDLQGELQQTVTLPRAAVALALDRSRSRLWVALAGELRIYDADGAVVRAVLQGPKDEIIDVAYDLERDWFWVNASNRLRRHDHSGNILFETDGAFSGSMASDAAGGLWLARDRELIHLDESGVADFSTTPFASGPDQQVVDLVADPHDASVWVASQRRIRHYAVDGALLNEWSPELGAGLIRRLHRASLYADLDPPEISITAPSEGSLLNNNRPVFGLRYFDLGVGVDPITIALTANGQAVVSSCQSDPSNARCTPELALPEGALEIVATVADFAGNVSEPGTVTITVDTIPPEITIAHPPDGFITNQAALSIRGNVNEPATVLINEVALAVGASGSFVFDAVLREGGNSFALSAADLAGNRATRSFAVTLDTIPPALPNAGLIGIGESNEGQVSITGAAGSVEPASAVRITNKRTGKTVVAVAGADGTFHATIEAEPGDELSIVVMDAAANSSSALASRVPGGLSLTIEEPIDGATIQHESVLVVGSFKGPLNTAVTVNGQPATIISEAGNLKFYLTVPLQSGENTVTVTAALQNGSTTSKVTRVRRAPGAFTVKLTPQHGILPLAARMSVSGDLGFYDFIRLDFDGDGRADAAGGGSFYGFSQPYTYSTPGIYRPSAEIFRYSFSSRRYELIYRQTLAVAVLDPVQLEEHMDRVLRSVWTGMNAALLAGDVSSALTAVSFDSRTVYGEVFQSLLAQMPNILDDFTDIEPLAISESYAEYVVMNVRNDKTRVHVINFIKGADGVWRIDSM